MSRRSARVCAYKLVFQYLFNRDFDAETREALLAELPDLTERDVDYIARVTQGVADNFDELTALIAAHAQNFALTRIFRPDMAALMLGCCEMKYLDDIPLSVSICEVVELVKSFSTEKSSVFVNGVLAGVYRELSQGEGSQC